MAKDTSESNQLGASRPSHLQGESLVDFVDFLGGQHEGVVPRDKGKTKGSKGIVGRLAALAVAVLLVVVPEVLVALAEPAEVLVVASGVVTQAAVLEVAPEVESELVSKLGTKAALAVLAAQPRVRLY